MRTDLSEADRFAGAGNSASVIRCLPQGVPDNAWGYSAAARKRMAPSFFSRNLSSPSSSENHRKPQQVHELFPSAMNRLTCLQDRSRASEERTPRDRSEKDRPVQLAKLFLIQQEQSILHEPAHDTSDATIMYRMVSG